MTIRTLNRRRTIGCLFACLAVLTLASLPASAGQLNPSTMTVTATVELPPPPACSILQASFLSFGTYTKAQANPLNQTTTVDVVCEAGAQITLQADHGINPANSITDRSMGGPGGTVLLYNLYRDAGLSVPWGLVQGGQDITTTAIGGAQSITIYGSIFPNQGGGVLGLLNAGDYQDTVGVTLFF
ncbi:MAG: Csu type fimbrial protein [Terriglobales bacterium]